MSATDEYSGDSSGDVAGGAPSLASPTGASSSPPGTDLSSPTKPQSTTPSNGHDAYDDGERARDRERDRDADYRDDQATASSPTAASSARDRPAASSSSASASSSGGSFGRSSYRQSARKLYVGNLAPGASQQDVMDLFARSPVPCALPSQVDMKPGYAFVHFDDATGVDEAVPRLNGSDLNGTKVRVEMSKPQSSSRCYTCGLEGHMSSQCTHGSGGRGRQPYAPSSSSRYGGPPPPSRYPPPAASSAYPPRSRSPDRYADPRYDPYARPRSPPRGYYDSRGSPPPPPARGGYEPRRDDRGRSPGRGDRSDRDRGYDRGGYDPYYPPPEPRGAYGGGYDRAPPAGPAPSSAYPPPPPAQHGYGAPYPPPPSSSGRGYY